MQTNLNTQTKHQETAKPASKFPKVTQVLQKIRNIDIVYK